MKKKENPATDGSVRVRYAPSPTGVLHIGNAQSALFNYLFAKHYNGTWVLRIEDTDIARNVPGGEKSQMDNLRWLGMEWDEGPDKPNPKYAPYHQQERVKIYHKYIQQLLDKGLAYKDYTTEEELQQMREKQKANGESPKYDGHWFNASEEQIKEAEGKGIKPTIRLHLPENTLIEWDDLIKGHIEFNTDNLGGDFVIEKSNGMATYNFAVVIDDYLMDITHVLRGDDHIANTPKQIAVYQALGFKQPRFGHISLVYSTKTHKKLSKRDKNTKQFIHQYRAAGYLPEAVFNFTAFLGWSPVGEREIYSREELIENYDINRMSASPAFFDQKKLDWINATYIKKFSVDELYKRIGYMIDAQESDEAKEIADKGIMNDDGFVKNIIKIYQNESTTLMDIMKNMMKYYDITNYDLSYSDFDNFDNETSKKILDSLKNELQSYDGDVHLSSDDVTAMLKKIQKELGCGAREFFMTLNITFTGSQSAPQISDIMSLIRVKDLIKLIDKAEKVL